MPLSNDPYQLLFAADVAKILGMTKGEVEHLAHRKRIRFRRDGGRVLFELGEIERYAARMAVTS